MTIDPQMAINMAVAIGIPLLGLAGAWGSLWTKLSSIERRLDVSNGSLQDHDKRLTAHGEDIARLQGERANPL